MKPLSEIKTRRNHIFKGFILVVILSSGVSLIANTITKDGCPLVTLISGGVCILYVAFVYLKEYFTSSSYETKIDTLFAVDKQYHVIPIDRFVFSEDLSRAVISVFAENKTYESLWREAFKSKIDDGKKGKAFVVEFIEYLFIKLVSLKLNSYFVDVDNSATELIGRSQIPDVLINNRVIEMISKPYEEREKFQKALDKNDSVEGRVVYMGGEDGALYDLLEIELPRGSRVTKESGELVISNKNFTIKFEAGYDGFSAITPRHFGRFYMKRSLEDFNCFKISMRMSINIKPLFFFSMRDRQYLGWLDHISDEFVKYFSFDDFIQRIGYEQAATEHILFLNGLKSKERSKEKSTTSPRVSVRIKEVEVKNK